jgi:hypothetical protein
MTTANPFKGVRLDANGKIIPTRAALDKVEREHSGKSDAEKWRLAQAQALIDAYQASKGGKPSMTRDDESVAMTKAAKVIPLRRGREPIAKARLEARNREEERTRREAQWVPAV